MENVEKPTEVSAYSVVEKSMDTPSQESDCTLEVKDTSSEPKPTSPDQGNNDEEIENPTEQASNDRERDTSSDEEGAIGIARSTSSSTTVASVQCSDSEEDLEPGKLRSCEADDAKCSYAECAIHKELCDFCATYCLEREDNEQRRLHRLVCQRERFFEQQYAIESAQSCDKVCGICMEVVMSKRPSEQRFGLLPKCMHVFCLKCIRNWRKVDTLTSDVRRGCPMCRTVSYFVCPSFVWLENKREKMEHIREYKRACRTIPCKYIQQDGVDCPFGRKCFYSHVRTIRRQYY